MGELVKWNSLFNFFSLFGVTQEWVCGFEKPQTSPNSLSPSTTVLSPYMTFGCLSVRTFWWSLTDVYQGVSLFKPINQLPLMGKCFAEFGYAQEWEVILWKMESNV